MPGFFPLEPPGDSGPYLLIVDDHPSFVQTLVRAIGSSAGRSAVASLQIRSIAWVSNEDEARAFLADPGRIGLVLLQANLGEGVRRQRRGLRLLEMGLADGTLSCPVLLMSLENPEVLLHDADHGYLMDIRQRFGLQSYSLRLPISLTAPDGTGLVDLLRSLSLDTTRQQFALADEESTRVVRRKKLEAENHRYRHDFANCKAAVRVLLGAIQAGDVSPECGAALLSQLQFLDPKRPSDFNMDILIRYQETVGEQIPHRLTIKNVLLIDDQQETSGWGLVLQAILKALNPDCTLVTAKTGEEGLKRISDVGDGSTSSNGFDLAFVDIDLSTGGGSLNGLEVLRELKRRQFDLHVIMLTAYDRAALTMTCFRLGAFDYFVKARDDSSDRNSLDYYLKFRKIISQLTPWDSEERRLWRRFAELEPAITALDDRLSRSQPDSDETIGGYLRKAYFFLTLDPRNSWARALLLPKGVAAQEDEMHAHLVESVLNSWLAVDRLLNGEARRLQIEMPASLNLFQRFRFLQYQRHHFLLGIAKSAYEKLNEDGGKLRHSGVVLQDFQWIRRSPDVAPRCFDEALTVVEQYLSNVRASVELSIAFCHEIDTKESLEVNEYAPARSPDLSHFERGRQSAIRLLVGARLAQGGDADDDAQTWRDLLAEETRAALCELLRDWQFSSVPAGRPKQVLFIDDEGDNSWWDLILQALLAQWGADVKWEPGLEKLTKASLEQFDIILLDLKLPAVKDGLNALTTIRKDAFALPVAILTASDDAVHVKRCLARGADEYFLKAAHAETDIPATRYYQDFCELADRLFKHGRSSPRRRLWDQLTAFYERNHWDDILSAPTIFADLERYYQERGLLHCGQEIAAYLQRATGAYLRKAYFFLTCPSDAARPDAWRIGRLLLGRGSAFGEAVLNCGKVVEFLVQHLRFVDPTAAKLARARSDDTGSILQARHLSLSGSTRQMGCSIWSRRSDVVHPGRADGPVGDTEAVTLFEQTIAFADAFREEFLAQVRRQADVAFQAIIGSRPLAEDGRSLLEQLDGIMKESSLNKCAQEAIAMRLHDWVQGVTLVRDQPEWATYVDTLGTSLFVAILEPLAYQPLKERQEKEVSKAETALATIDGDMDRAKKALNAVSEKPRQEAQRLTQERDRQAALLTQSAEAIRLLHEQQCKLATVPQTGSNRTLQTQLAERLQHEEREHHKLQAALVDLDRLLQTVLERLAQRIEPLNAKLNELSQQRVLVAGELEEKKATLAEMNRCCSVVNPISTEDHANWLITHGILSQTQADHLRALSNQLIARDVLGAIAQSAELIRSFLPTPQRPP